MKSDADLDEIDLLVVGRQALPGCPLPLAEKMRRGGRLLVLEQDSAGLAEFGFRSNEYGIRTVFPLVADFTAKLVRDWRGASTLTPPELALPGWERQDPVWNWQGFSNTRAWRAGNRGNICSVPLEKPVIGDFLPLMQCGFDLQYTPAVEWRSGNGIAIFSQFDSYEIGNLITDVPFMGKTAYSTIYRGYKGDDVIQGTVIMANVGTKIYAFHFSCAADDYDDMETVMYYLRTHVEAKNN